jgi:hypothetical protein
MNPHPYAKEPTMLFRNYKRNRLINAFMLEVLDQTEIEDTWGNRLIILESIKDQWETKAAHVFTDPADIREFSKFMKALDEEIAYNLDRCIETSCPR